MTLRVLGAGAAGGGASHGRATISTVVTSVGELEIDGDINVRHTVGVHDLIKGGSGQIGTDWCASIGITRTECSLCFEKIRTKKIRLVEILGTKETRKTHRRLVYRSRCKR